MFLDNKALGNRIKEEREKIHITQQNLAEVLNISTYYLGRIERGERNVSLEKLVGIASYFNISLDYLVFGNSAKTNENNFTELYELLDKCSEKEKEVLSDVIKALIPHIKKLTVKR